MRRFRQDGRGQARCRNPFSVTRRPMLTSGTPWCISSYSIDLTLCVKSASRLPIHRLEMTRKCMAIQNLVGILHAFRCFKIRLMKDSYSTQPRTDRAGGRLCTPSLSRCCRSRTDVLGSSHTATVFANCSRSPRKDGLRVQEIPLG